MPGLNTDAGGSVRFWGNSQRQFCWGPTSDRVFPVACSISGRVLSDITRKVRAEAPGVKIEWLSAPRQVYGAVAEGLVDIAHLGGETRRPDGLDAVKVAPFRWTSFLRDGHPALAEWGPAAWSR
jgi:DNA-binding transcriptional LysR family regulator